MSKDFNFFCCACCILLFTIINLSVGPNINKKLGDLNTLNCARDKHDYDRAKERGISGDELKYEYEWYIKQCQNGKAMYNMEYTSFIFDLIIGFVCGLLGLLHLFDANKNFISKTGLIGLGCGVIGFILTFVYIILNGIVYTSYYIDDIYKRDSDGAFAEKKGNEFDCLYFDVKENDHALIAKFSDLIKKQYNYNKDISKSYSNSDVSGCKEDPNECIQNNGKIPAISYNTNCKKLYVIDGPIETFVNKDISDRFLTTLLLSLFVCFANIGLALFGFLLFRAPGDFQTKTDADPAAKNPTSKFSVDQKLNN